MTLNTTNLTIAIITCRRPQWLNRLLCALTQQVVSNSIKLDILVVDNAIDAETKTVVQSVSKTSPFSMHYDVEPKPGIVFARNKCVELFLRSESEYLAFIDDDEWPAETNWIESLLKGIEKHQVDIVTSHVVSVGEIGTPDWAVDLIYGRNPYSAGQTISIFYTNNLLISRHVLESVTPAFDQRFAMTGASDYHFALKCQKAGFSCKYINAPVEEEFPKSRATVKWFIRRGFRSGIGYTRAHVFEDTLFKALALSLFMSLIRGIRGIGYCIYGVVTLKKRLMVDGLFRISSGIGTLVGLFGVKHNEYNTIHGK